MTFSIKTLPEYPISEGFFLFFKVIFEASGSPMNRAFAEAVKFVLRNLITRLEEFDNLS